MSDFRFNKYFKRSEFACGDRCGFDSIDKLTFEYLMAARLYFDHFLVILSACRCTKHNKEVGGEEDSQHLYARAVDHFIVGVTPKQLYEFYEDKFKGKFGLGLYSTFVHMDTKTGYGRRWTG